MFQWERITQAIKDAGSLGITTASLYRELEPDAKEGFSGCANYTGRISDARKHGFVIQAFQIPDSPQSRYFLMEDPQGNRLRESIDCEATTQRLALKRVKKVTWSNPAPLVSGGYIQLGEWVLA